MKTVLTLWLLFAMWGLTGPVTGTDWSGWRGPNGDGTAGAGTNVDRVPLSWGPTTNVVWKASLPGEGHSTPIVLGDKVVLTYSDDVSEVQSVLCLRRADGSVLWERQLFQGNLAKKIHKKNTHATPSPTSDGERVYVSFYNDGAVQLTALSLADGLPIWQVTAGPFKELFNFGYAPSPLLYGNTVIVSSDYKRGGFLVAYDKGTGREIWRTPRTGSTSYSSPMVGRVAGRDQLLISGDKRISSYDPATGRLLWSAKAVTEATCGTLVWDGERVFGSGGFPGKETAAVMADG
ncbi:MAG: PQQ-binding-like beta-propeller repeat protein [Verrucomicrobiota bacterium]